MRTLWLFLLLVLPFTAQAGVTIKRGPGGASGAGTGDIEAVGNCVTGSAFTGACGTTLSSNTDIILDLDQDNNTVETFLVRDGADATILELTEAGVLTIPQLLVSAASARADISGSAPLLAFNDTDGVLNAAGSGEIRFENAQSICWEQDPAGADICISVTAAEVIALSGLLGIQSAADPAPAAAGVTGFDNDHYAAGHGAINVHDGTAETFVVATTDAPGDNQIPQFDLASGTVLWENAGAGAGDVESVGDCASGDCFEGVGAETTLSSATDLIFDIDADNNANEVLTVTGSVGKLFEVAEGVSGAYTEIDGDLIVNDSWPALFISDMEFGSQNVLWHVTCPTDNDCSWQMTNESGSAGTRVSMLSLMTTDAGESTLYLGGAGAESVGGALASAPDAIGVDETGNATFNTTGGDPADAGKIRLNNTDQVCWEANPTGTEFCLAGDASEVINASGGVIDVDDVGTTSLSFAVSGNDLCWDLDANGCDDGDPKLTMNAPANAAGDETVQGSLTVTNDFLVTDVDEPLESVLYSFRTSAGTTGAASGGAIPGPDDCYPMFGYYTSPVTAAGADPSGSCEHALTDDLYLTQMCTTFVTGTAPTGNCILGLYEKGERGTLHATFDVGAAGAEIDSVGDTKCVSINVSVDDGVAESLYFQADTDAADCDASANWPELEITLRGYRINYAP